MDVAELGMFVLVLGTTRFWCTLLEVNLGKRRLNSQHNWVKYASVCTSPMLRCLAGHNALCLQSCLCHTFNAKLQWKDSGRNMHPAQLVDLATVGMLPVCYMRQCDWVWW